MSVEIIIHTFVKQRLFLTCKDNGNNLDSQIFSEQSFVVFCKSKRGHGD